jgi:hypothetical protein
LLDSLELVRGRIEFRLGLVERLTGVGGVVRRQSRRAKSLDPATTDDERRDAADNEDGQQDQPKADEAKGDVIREHELPERRIRRERPRRRVERPKVGERKDDRAHDDDHGPGPLNPTLRHVRQHMGKRTPVW